MPRPRFLFVLVLVLALAHAVLYDLPFEDAFITFRYVENWASGHGLAFNPGERADGFTSFGWVAMLGVPALLGMPVPGTARLLSLAFGLCLVALTAALARRFGQPSRYAWLAPPLFVAAQGTLAYYAMTGMETTLFACLVTAGALFAAEPTRRGAACAGALLGVAALVRPEGVGYFAAIALGRVVGQGGRRFLPLLAVAFMMTFLPWFVWHWVHFGWPLPNTYYAKAVFSRELPLRGARELERFLTHGGYWAAVAGLVFVLHRSSREADASDARRAFPWIAASVMAAAGANVILIGGDIFFFHRFLLPAIPIAALVIVEAARTILARKLEETSHSAAWGTLAVILFAAWSVGASFLPGRSLLGDRGSSDRDGVTHVDRINRDYFVVGRFLRAVLDPGTLVALNAAGIVPYESRLPTLDMLGLNDAHIAHAPHDGRGALGHQAYDARYVLERDPAVVLPGLPVLTEAELLARDFAPWLAHWFPFLPGDRALIEDPAFRERYGAASLMVRPNGFLTVFIRKDRPPRLHLRRARETARRSE